MPITALPEFPAIGDAAFNSKAYAWANALPTFRTEANTLGTAAAQAVTDAQGQVTLATTQAGDAATSATTALSAKDAALAGANFKGAWSSLTGALAMPASVSHGTTVYLLLSNLADVTVKVPGVASEWLDMGSYRHIPQNSRSADYTLVLDDAGKHILHPSADTTARTFTIPSNAAVAFPIGTAITFVNQNDAGLVTIAITSDTLRLAGYGTTGSKSLHANGTATAIKLTATEWIISGTGLS